MTEYRRSAANHRTQGPTRRGVLALGAGMVAMLLSVPGFAQRGDLAPSPVVSLQDAVSIATARRPGRVVRAVTVEVGSGRRIHEVRILLNEGGRVVTVRVDAQTGRVR